MLNTAVRIRSVPEYSGHTKSNCDTGCDHAKNAPENGISDTCQWSHQTGFYCVDGICIKIFLLAVLFLHGSNQPHDKGRAGDRGIEVRHTSYQCFFFAFFIIFVEFIDKRHQCVTEADAPCFAGLTAAYKVKERQNAFFNIFRSSAGMDFVRLLTRKIPPLLHQIHWTGYLPVQPHAA